MLQRGADHAVAGARTAVGRRDEFRHQKQADAAHPWRCIGQPSQHQMDDVLRQVVLAGTDEDFRPADPVAAVRLRHRAGAQHAEVGAAMRLGQAHGARPGAVDHLGKIGVLQLVSGVTGDCLTGAMRKSRIQTEGEVGGAGHLLDQLVQALRQTLPAVARIGGKRGPAAMRNVS